MNATVTCICGRIASGKSTLAARLRLERRAVLLSCDEITLALFDEQIGERHDEIVARTQAYLLNKAVEIAEVGVPVILDWGFWTRQEREEAAHFFRRQNIPLEWIYVDVSDEVWHEHLNRRNAAIRAGHARFYFIDDAIAAKFSAMFEVPAREEIDVWIDGTHSLYGDPFTMNPEL